MGEMLRNEGMTLSYHNHNFEMKKYDDMTWHGLHVEDRSLGQ